MSRWAARLIVPSCFCMCRRHIREATTLCDTNVGARVAKHNSSTHKLLDGKEMHAFADDANGRIQLTLRLRPRLLVSAQPVRVVPEPHGATVVAK